MAEVQQGGSKTPVLVLMNTGLGPDKRTVKVTFANGTERQFVMEPGSSIAISMRFPLAVSFEKGIEGFVR